MSYPIGKLDVMGRDARRVIDMRGQRRFIPFDIPDFQHHFRITQASSTSISVHAGTWSRRSHTDQVTVLMGIDGSLTSGAYADVLTITGLTATRWIILTLDNSLNPTTLTASAVAAYPTADGTKVKFVLGKVTCASSVISAIEQYWTGGDIEDYYQVLDAASLGFNSTDEAEIKDFLVTTTGETPAADDLFIFKNISDGDTGYATVADTADLIADELTGASGPWSPGNEPWTQASAVSHHDLSGLNDTQDDADHPWAMCHTASGYTSDYTQNYCSSFGRANGSIGIDMDNSYLIAAGGVGHPDLDWALHVLDGGNWSVAVGHTFSVLDTTEATFAGVAALAVTGGIYSGKKMFALDNITSVNGYLSAGTAVYATTGYYVGATQGQAITNWFTGGMFMGSTVVEKQIQALSPTDKVLVIPG